MSAAHLLPLDTIRWNAAALDLSVERLLAAARIDLAGRVAISNEESVSLWSAAERLTGDDCVGHRAGARLRPMELGAIGGVFAHAADIRGGLSNLVAVLGPVLPGKLELEPSSGGLRLEYRRPPELPGSRHGVESLCAGVVAAGRYCSRASFALARVAFSHAAPKSSARHDAFYGVKVEWGAAVTSLDFDADTLARPMSAPNPALTQLLLTHAREVVPRTNNDLEERVRDALLAALHLRDPSLAGAARELGVGERTLQRQLSEAGVSFRELRESVLQERAESLLRASDAPLREIASILGYATRASFERAFQRWSDVTPAEYRAAAREQPR